MSCSGIRKQPRPPTRSYPAFGEKGMMLVEYVGDNPETVYGEITNAAYPFDNNLTRFVDIRDAAYLLGTEFIEVE